MKKKSVLLLLQLFSLGVFSQVRDTLPIQEDSLSIVRVKASNQQLKHNKTVSYIAPAVFLGYGFVSLESKLLRKIDHNLNSNIRGGHPDFKTQLDDYLQYAPAVAVYGLNLSGIKGKNNFIDRSALFLISNLIMGTSVTFFKKKTHRLRPNQFSYDSFPSGHTATAFVGAEFMSQEYEEISPWYSIAGYTVATATGALRMYNNAHWFSDVVAGAGFGILSTKVAYLVYPYLKRQVFHEKPLKYIATPTYQQGVVGFSFIKAF